MQQPATGYCLATKPAFCSIPEVVELQRHSELTLAKFFHDFLQVVEFGAGDAQFVALNGGLVLVMTASPKRRGI